ncbi:cytochrome c biogenesis CcdA family protein [Halorussus halobius]|uniref:cytochrome c biogenesis CcdA family protein n=1 Tax=Halorussus halobius TaxID=1710537 RepID=UPI001091AB45|nr:cytochrome c biogenesis protein CcdA [Halorussus halobius]
MSGPVWSHLAFAASAGVVTFLSPCALPLVPGYVGYYAGVAGDDRRAAGIVARGLAAGGGVVATLGALAGLAVLVGRPVSGLLAVVEPLVGVALVVFGVGLLTARGPTLTVPLPARRADAPGFALFGAGYAGASAGCVLPVFLAVVVQAVALSARAAVAVVAAYAAGVAVPLVALTLAVGFGLDVATGRLADLGGRLERAAGAVVSLAGVGQIVLAVAPNAVPSLPI